MKQRRKAAASVVQSLWSSKTTTEKEKQRQQKAKRPIIQIQPGDFGPIEHSQINENDVLCGRGGRINSHSGNIQFRSLCYEKKTVYLCKSTKKLEKAHIAADVVEHIRGLNPPGRFLKEDGGTGMLWDIGDAKAIKKVGQCMREDAPATREQLSNCSEKEDPETAVKAPETVVSVTIPLYPPTHKQQKASALQAKKQVMSELEQSSGGPPGAYREEGIDQGAYDEMKMEPLRPTAVDADAFGRNFHPAPSSNMSTGVSSLLEQSIISGISDGVSSITFGDDYHFHHRHKNPSYSYSHAPTNPPGRKRQASEGTSMFGMHHRKFVPAYAMSPIKKAAPIHDNNSDAMDVEQQMQPAYQQPLPPAAHAPNNMMLGCHQKEMEQSQNRSTTRSHVSDMSAGAFSVSMNSLPSIGSFASVSV